MANRDKKVCTEVEDYESSGNLVHCLIKRNMLSVAEKMFFYLDYESYTNCLEVCKEWRGFLFSRTAFARAKRLFGAKMWTDAARTKKLQRVNIVPKVKVICWTTNDREVAYLEDEAGSGVTLLHFIDEEGDLHSTKLKEMIQHENEGSLNEGIGPYDGLEVLSNHRCG